MELEAGTGGAIFPPERRRPQGSRDNGVVSGVLLHRRCIAVLLVSCLLFLALALAWVLAGVCSLLLGAFNLLRRDACCCGSFLFCFSVGRAQRGTCLLCNFIAQVMNFRAEALVEKKSLFC